MLKFVIDRNYILTKVINCLYWSSEINYQYVIKKNHNLVLFLISWRWVKLSVNSLTKILMIEISYHTNNSVIQFLSIVVQIAWIKEE